jgi:hypothetical protein
MFGVIRGDRFHLTCLEQREFMGHVCGTCLALGNSSGQIGRLTTNYDAALLSVLYEAMSPTPMPRKTHYCPLRRGRRGEVVVPTSPGARYAASISLVSAATKVQDHLADGDGRLRWWPGLFRRLAQWWAAAARRTAVALGFPTERITTQVEKQDAVEAEPDRDFVFYAAPTEESVGAACSHVAQLAGCPEKAGILDRIGRLFGRIMYLLDACKDYADDLAKGRFNPLARCGTPREARRRARALFDEAHTEIKTRFAELAPPNPALAKRLLIDQLAMAADAALGDYEPPDPGVVVPPIKRPVVHLRKRNEGGGKSQENCCGDTGCDCFGDALCDWGCDASFPDCSDAGCGDLCGGADACSGCDVSCN